MVVVTNRASMVIIEALLLRLKIPFYWATIIGAMPIISDKLEGRYVFDEAGLYHKDVAGIDKKLTIVLEYRSEHETFFLVIPMPTSKKKHELADILEKVLHEIQTN